MRSEANELLITAHGALCDAQEAYERTQPMWWVLDGYAQELAEEMVRLQQGFTRGDEEQVA